MGLSFLFLVKGKVEKSFWLFAFLLSCATLPFSSVWYMRSQIEISETKFQMDLSFEKHRAAVP